VSRTPRSSATHTPTFTLTETPTPAAQATACPRPYVVQRGDWIYKIARECGLDPRDLIAANPGIDPNRIVAGQRLTLPTSTAVP
jgi:LysM repeat protein